MAAGSPIPLCRPGGTGQTDPDAHHLYRERLHERDRRSDFDPGNYLTPLPSETRTYELTGFRPTGDTSDSASTNGQRIFRTAPERPEIGYEETADPKQEQKRLIERVRTRYRRNDLTDLLPLGALDRWRSPARVTGSRSRRGW